MVRTSCVARTAGAIVLHCGMLAGGERPAWAAELPSTEPLSPLPSNYWARRRSNWRSSKTDESRD